MFPKVFLLLGLCEWFEFWFGISLVIDTGDSVVVRVLSFLIFYAGLDCRFFLM